MAMDFDHVLAECGNWNRYQLIVLLMYGYICLLSPFHYFSQTLITFTPDHWCYHEKLDNLSHAEIRSIYAQTSGNPSCTLLDDLVNGTAIVAPVGECRKWIFAYERNYESITTELQWVCDNAFQSAVGQSLFFVGSAVGTIVFGFLGDKIGRLPALILTTLAGASGDFSTSFVHSMPAFVVGRFIAGISTNTTFYLCYIIVFECLDPKKRTFGLNIILTFFYCFGTVISPWLAILAGTWRKYLLIASLPSLGILTLPLFICESAQWLLTKGKYERAVNCLKHIARCNGRTVPDSTFDQLVEHYKQKRIEEEKLSEQRDTFLGMLRTPRLRKFTIILLIKSMIITLAFDTISRNVEGLGTPAFELFSYTAFAFIPSGFTIILLQDRIGRKGATIVCLLIGGIITIITGFLIAFLDHDTHAMLLAIMVGLGRYGVIVAYDAEAQYGAEIIPTSVRGQGLSNIHVVGLGFTFLSAYVIYLGNFYKPLPSIFIGIILLVGMLLCLALPETLNKKLPETLSDGEVFGLGEKWYYFSCFDKRQQRKVPNKQLPNNQSREITLKMYKLNHTE